MVSTVRARPNHYQTLGLSPGASEAEIADAFAKAISTPRGLGGIAEASIAYEALRDPERRKAYDRSIGIGVEPEPEAEPAPAPPREWSPFLIRAAARPAGPPSHDPLPPPRLRPEPGPEPRPFVAAPATVATRPEPHALPAPDPLPRVEVHFPEAEDFVIDWKRTAIVAGAVVLGVGMVGAWAGLAASSDIQATPQAQAKQAVTMKLAPPEPLPAVAAAPPAPARSYAQPRRARTAPAPPPQSRADRVAEIKRGLQDYYASTTSTAATDAPAAPVQAASMPLSSATVARTIHHIGYPCGSVASTESAGGGVFNVTCTSGHSYRAAPVRGRYHFRRVR